jgi:hypothetical protein
MENFKMYEKLMLIFHDKYVVTSEILKYGIDNGIDFSQTNWKSIFTTFDVSDFELVKKYTKIIEHLGILEVEDTFADYVCSYYFFVKKLCSKLHMEKYKIILEFLCQHPVFLNCTDADVPEKKWLLNFENQAYRKCLTDNYLFFLDKFLVLKKINIAHNKKVTCDGIKCLTNLTHININFTKITDEVVKNLTNLTHLDAYNTKITDDGIKNLTNLTHLDVSSTKITDEAFKNLTNLIYLRASNTKITDDGIKNLTNLTYLDVCMTYITYEGIKNLPNLTTLLAWNTCITYEEIKNLPNLVYFEVDK